MWALAVALWPQVQTRAGKVGWWFLIIAGLVETLASVFDITHDTGHSIVGALGIGGFPINELPDEHRGAFGPQDILRISEIGLVVDDVQAQAINFKNRFNLEPYRGRAADFTDVGDAYGLFITMRRGRPWRPTTTERAAVAPVQVTIEGTSEQSYTVSHFPYTINVMAS